MSIDSAGTLKNGIILASKTWDAFLKKLDWEMDQIDKVICHQVEEKHSELLLKELRIDPKKDFSTYKYLGNTGTASIPLTTAMAEKRGFLKTKDCVVFMGIGSGLNCMMLGWEW